MNRVFVLTRHTKRERVHERGALADREKTETAQHYRDEQCALALYPDPLPEQPEKRADNKA